MTKKQKPKSVPAAAAPVVAPPPPPPIPPIAAGDRQFMRAVGRTMAIVRDIEASGAIPVTDVADLYAQFRFAMRTLLGCADLRPFYQRSGKWGNASTRDWLATNMLAAGARMAPHNPKATTAASEIAIVVLELLTRYEMATASTESPEELAKSA